MTWAFLIIILFSLEIVFTQIKLASSCAIHHTYLSTYVFFLVSFYFKEEIIILSIYYSPSMMSQGKTPWKDPCTGKTGPLQLMRGLSRWKLPGKTPGTSLTEFTVRLNNIYQLVRYYTFPLKISLIIFCYQTKKIEIIYFFRA